MANNESSTSDATLTVQQAYEAAFRFVSQYAKREPIEPFLLMLVAMEPQDDQYLTNDPASWPDWLRCVSETLDGAPLPSLTDFGA